MSAAINVGASKEAIEEARKGVLDILRSDSDESTKTAALSTFARICEVKYTNITGNNIRIGEDA